MDREALCRRFEAGERPRLLLFWGHTAPAGGGVGRHVLSQWWPAPFVVDGQRYPTAEHWMMAEKARLFGDAEALAAVLSSLTPAAAKAHGRGVRGFEEERWTAVRLEVVVRGNVHKFGSDPELRAFLLATDDQVLVEAAPRDRVWGIGFGAEHPDAGDPRTWRGDNLLGFALMAARERLAAAGKASGVTDRR